MAVLVTGAAGFIGHHVAIALLSRDEEVIGIDNMNDYYDRALKDARVRRLEGHRAFTFHTLDITDRAGLESLLDGQPAIDRIIHLAAQAGVRYSLVNPYAYADANVLGSMTVLEACRHLPKLRHFVYASSSSVYGANEDLPFAIGDDVDRPVSVYAATKRAGELLAFTYSHLYRVPATGLRFFTVYGPWGRPDMAYYGFTDSIFAGRPIKIFNQGAMRRDFTYIDDVVAGVLAALDRPPADEGKAPPNRLYNLGNHRSEDLLHFISVLERICGRQAVKEFAPMQPGDIRETYADIETSRRDLGFQPTTTIEEGLARFVAWYREYHGV